MTLKERCRRSEASKKREAGRCANELIGRRPAQHILQTHLFEGRQQVRCAKHGEDRFAQTGGADCLLEGRCLSSRRCLAAIL